MIHLWFVLGVVLSRVRRWRVISARSFLGYAQRAWACRLCPALFSGLLLTGLMVMASSTVSGGTLMGWAAIIATQLRWRGNRRMWSALCHEADRRDRQCSN